MDKTKHLYSSGWFIYLKTAFYLLVYYVLLIHLFFEKFIVKLNHSGGVKSFRKLCFVTKESRATVKYLSDNLIGSWGELAFFLIRNRVRIFTFHNEMATLSLSHLSAKVYGFLCTCPKVLASESDLNCSLYSSY